MNRLIRIILAQEQRDFRDRPFYSSEPLRREITEDIIRDAFRDKNAGAECRLAPEFIESAVQAILNGGHRVFAILSLNRHARLIRNFAESDSSQDSKLDQGLPFEQLRLQHILDDEPTAREFFNRQWSFTSPVFSSSVFTKSFPQQTIFPFLEQRKLDEGTFGVVFDLNIAPSHHKFATGAVSVCPVCVVAPGTANVLCRSVFASSSVLARKRATTILVTKITSQATKSTSRKSLGILACSSLSPIQTYWSCLHATNATGTSVSYFPRRQEEHCGMYSKDSSLVG